MSGHITVVLNNGLAQEFTLSDADLARFDSMKAVEWIEQEFDAAGAVGRNSIGKLLLFDKILILAMAQPDSAYKEATPWVMDFLTATAVAMGQRRLKIDLATRALSY